MMHYSIGLQIRLFLNESLEGGIHKTIMRWIIVFVLAGELLQHFHRYLLDYFIDLLPKAKPPQTDLGW